MTGETATAPGSRVVNALIADDAFDSRQWLMRLLRQFMKVRVREARDGVEALEAFKLQDPDIVFLDIDMPQMDGMSVLKDIRDSGKPVFVVMVTASSAAAKVQEAVALGVNGFVVKPYSARRILDMLERFAKHAGMGDAMLPL